MNNDLLVVSGMSGAGKSQAMDVLEDMGYFCADNVPPALISTFAALPKESQNKIRKIALVVDVRSRDTFSDIQERLEELRKNGVAYKLLFLDCAEDTLETRYKETRRRHPLIDNKIRSTASAVAEERRMMESVRQQADHMIDTTMLSPTQLKSKIREIFAEGDSISMSVSCMSFGFKYGLPRDSDLVFDVRCISNPFYLPELRPQTGLDFPVVDYVISTTAAQMLRDKLYELLDFLVPLYIQEGKSQLVIAVGCTGGRHRSVVFAELLARHLESIELRVDVMHRDIHRADQR